MFLKKNRQTEERKTEEQKKKTPFSLITQQNTKRNFFIIKVHYLVPHALRTSIAQKKKKEKGVVVLVER